MLQDLNPLSTGGRRHYFRNDLCTIYKRYQYSTYLYFFAAGSLFTGLLIISWDAGGGEGLWKSEGRLHTARGSVEEGGLRGWVLSEHSPSTIIISPSSSVSSAGVSKTSSFTSTSVLTETCEYYIPYLSQYITNYALLLQYLTFINPTVY